MEVKVLDFWVASKGRIERELEQLLDKGWRIAAAAGGGWLPWYMVILQREEPATTAAIARSATPPV